MASNTRYNQHPFHFSHFPTNILTIGQQSKYFGVIQTSAGVFFPGCADCMLPLPLIQADQDTVIRMLQAKGFDYDLLVRLRSVIDSMGAAYSTADFSDFQ